MNDIVFSSMHPEEKKLSEGTNTLSQFDCGYLNRGQSLVGQTNVCKQRDTLGFRLILNSVNLH